MNGMSGYLWLLVFAIAGAAFPRIDAAAETSQVEQLAGLGHVHVGPDGTDSPTCGSEFDKCRSISQGIKNARPWATVNVHPGIYGDINGNGVIGEPGEESGGPDCDCMIHVDKLVRLSSYNGTDTVVIEARTTDLTAIRIDADDARIGAWSSSYPRAKGFTIMASAATGTAAITSNRSLSARVQGNSIHAKYGGIWGSNLGVSYNDVYGATGGPAIDAGANARVFGNTIITSEEGIIIANGYVYHNTIVGGSYAIEIYDPRFARVMQNAIVNNRYAGITINAVEEGYSVDVRIHDNNIVGNGFADGAYCGVVNRSDGIVWAQRNYWGPFWTGTPNVACDFGSSVTNTGYRRSEPRRYPTQNRGQSP
jgi:hypothetical protein